MTHTKIRKKKSASKKTYGISLTHKYASVTLSNTCCHLLHKMAADQPSCIPPFCFVPIRNFLPISLYHVFFLSLSVWIGHILRRNCLLKHVIEGKLEGRIEMTERRGRRRKQLLHDLNEKRNYWKLKEEALDRTLWRTRFGRGYGHIVRQAAE
jgi:hypothetical protein